MAFLSPNKGWVEVSSSAGYSLFCYQTAQPPAACSQATTSIDATDDGGHTWRRLLRFTSKPFIGPNAVPTAWMHLFDARHALVLPLAVQPHAMLYCTADGGATWVALPLPRRLTSVTLTDVAFVSQRNLWLLDHLGVAAGSEAVRVYRTQDAGRHWSLVACTAFPNSLPGSGCPLRSGLGLGGHKDNIVFASPATGFLADNNNSGIPFLYVTHDGGVHWRPESPGLPRGVPAPNSKTGVYPYAEFQQPLFFGRFGILPTTVRVCRRAHSPTGYVCTHGLYALLSRDGGRTWPLTRRFPLAPASPYRLAWQVMTATTWRALVGTRLWSTHDAGVHWTAIQTTLPRGYTPLAVQFVTPITGWAIVARIFQPDNLAQTTRLLRTDDGGVHWSVVPLSH